MRVNMLLCDYAAVADGKLQVIGGGWNSLNGQTPFAIALLIEVPDEALGEPHQLTLSLVDSNGLPVAAKESGGGVSKISLQGEFQVDKRPGAPGFIAPAVVPVTFGVGPLPLTAATGYEWRLEIDGEAREEWALPFHTSPAA